MRWMLLAVALTPTGQAQAGSVMEHTRPWPKGEVPYSARRQGGVESLSAANGAPAGTLPQDRSEVYGVDGGCRDRTAI